ncbi:MAG: DUF4013 domain-containing protein [Nitrososphaerota archaeon]
MRIKLEENLRDSYEYAVKLFKNVGGLAALIILNIIPIVNFIVMGYFAKVIKESPRSTDPPRLEKYGELWIDGAKIFVVTIIYMIVPIILVAIGASSMIVAGIFMPMIGLGIMGGVLIVAGIILAFLIMIIAIMAIAHMVKMGKLGSAFDFNSILSKIKLVGWGSYVLWIIILFAISLILGGISFIPYIGWIITLIISPVFMVFIGRSISNIYESTVVAPSPQLETTQPSLFCGYCGNPLKPDDKFCGKCGRPVKQEIP